MNRKRTKLVVIILIIFVGLVTINLNKSKVKSNNLIKETNNKSFAYFVQNDTGYSEQKSGQIPTGYKINYTKTKCYDYDNEEVTANTTISMNKNKLSVLSNKTVYCKVYLDKQKGTGTQNNPYQIEYIEDLVELSNEVNSGTNYSGMYFALMKDLDFNKEDSYRSYNSRAYGDINNNGKIESILTELTTGDGFIPIGTDASHPFSGNFDGKEHTLNNLHIVNDVSDTIVYIGFFGVVGNCKIENLTINGTVKGESNVAGIIARVQGETIISNVHNKVNLVSSASVVGGIIANIQGTDTKIYNSSNDVNFTIDNERGTVGGIVGFTSGKLLIDKCYNLGTLGSTEKAGGLIGYDYTNSSTTITDSRNEGNITGNYYVGGLIGLIQGILSMNNSYNSAEVKCASDTNKSCVGGIVGCINGNNVESLNINKISGSYNKGNITDGCDLGGIVGNIQNKAKLIINGCYNSGNLTSSITKTDTIGGLVGDISNSSVGYILNSYNSGGINIKYSNMGYNPYASGIGTTDSLSKVTIINSYNVGTVDANVGLAMGVLGATGGSSWNETTTVLNNVYNMGKVTAKSGFYEYGFGSIVSSTKQISNIYYDTSTAATGASSGVSVTGMTTANMKSATFVNTLNTNKNSINLSSIDSNLTGYTLKNWTLGSESYPVLVN